ncbi:hypothetical protein [Basilea psittacipulmonis]|uniref:Uncharacterized protein n=1 Tax=Basilea psittacipulmonis DSM 24701 TaxID=1072685 RepID=A0A077DDR2_9BURK|nr:hypothetical protein [Basilea psittacipulmonis]AIL33010.1 hypothetical protein IX83_06505 [Basilea psittacipulmonis DSM 24701]
MNTLQFLAHLGVIFSIGFMASFLSISLLLLVFLCTLKFTRFIQEKPYIASYQIWNRCLSISLLMTTAMAVPVVLQISSVWPNIWSYMPSQVSVLLCLSTCIIIFCQLGLMRSSLYEKYNLQHQLLKYQSLGATILFFILVYFTLLSTYWIIHPQEADFSQSFNIHIFFSCILLAILGALPLGLLMLTTVTWRSSFFPLHEGNRLVQKNALIFAWIGWCTFALLSLLLHYNVPNYWQWGYQNHPFFTLLFILGLLYTIAIIIWLTLHWPKYKDNQSPVLNQLLPYTSLVGLIISLTFYAVAIDYALSNQLNVLLLYEGDNVFILSLGLVIWFSIYALLTFAFGRMMYSSAKNGIELLHSSHHHE